MKNTNLFSKYFAYFLYTFKLYICIDMPIFFSIKNHLGWGGEDDDLWVNRISPQTHGVMLRYQSSISKYRMLQHEKASPSADRFQKLKKGNDNYFEDGLNNVEYSVISKVERNLYTHILVTI